MRSLLAICLLLLGVVCQESSEEHGSTLTHGSMSMTSEGSNMTPSIDDDDDDVDGLHVEEESHWQAFFASLGAIFVSEIGDRTFFVAAIMAMRYDKTAVFCGGAGALVLMTLISCIFGQFLPRLLPKVYTQIAAMILFFYFGLRLLYEWRFGEESEHDEKKEVEQEMQILHQKLVSSVSGGGHEGPLDPEKPVTKQKGMNIPYQTVMWQAFILTFLGEWGDRSQLATIALSAVQHAWIVFLGGALGHIICTIIAIIGGELVSDKISEKTVNLIGGMLFTVFGVVQGVVLLMESQKTEEPPSYH